MGHSRHAETWPPQVLYEYVPTEERCVVMWSPACPEVSRTCITRISEGWVCRPGSGVSHTAVPRNAALWTVLPLPPEANPDEARQACRPARKVLNMSRSGSFGPRPPISLYCRLPQRLKSSKTKMKKQGRPWAFLHAVSCSMSVPRSIRKFNFCPLMYD